MRPRTLLVLFILVAGLAAFIWFVERDLPSSEERAERARRLLELEAENVVVLEIDRGDQRVRLERQRAEASEESEEEEEAPKSAGEEWRLVEPLVAPADGAAVNGLVRSLTSLEKERTLDGVDPDEVGLDQPRASVTLGDGEKDLTLHVGGEVPATQTVVVGLAGREDELYVVSDSFWSELSKEPGDWRDRKVFAGTRDEIQRLNLTVDDGGKILLARRAELFWLESPIVDRADESKVDSLLTEIVGLRIEKFLDKPELSASEMGLEPAQGMIELFIEDREQPLRVEIGNPVDEAGSEPQVAGAPQKRYARVDGQTFETAAELDEVISRSAEDWQSRAWTSLDTYQIDAVEIEDESGETKLERAGGDWIRDQDKIPYEQGSDFLYALTEAEGERVLSPAEADDLGVDLDRPTLTVTLSGSGDREETLELYSAVEGGVPARSRGREFVILIPDSRAEELRVRLDQLRTVEPLADEEGELLEAEVGEDP